MGLIAIIHISDKWLAGFKKLETHHLIPHSSLISLISWTPWLKKSRQVDYSDLDVRPGCMTKKEFETFLPLVEAVIPPSVTQIITSIVRDHNPCRYIR